MHLPDPTFPPLLEGVPVKSPDRPFDLARSRAASGRAGAGDVFWARATDRMDVAIVLEPDVPLAQAVHMPFAAMVALGDALGAIAPPEIGVYYRWPGDIVVNGARAGEMRFAIPGEARPEDVPDWLVVAMTVRIMADMSDPDPGRDLENTALYEEGCADVTRTSLVESFSRHLLVWINTWEDEGFRPISEIWVERARKLSDEVVAGDISGKLLGLDDAGNLLVKPAEGAAVSLAILDHAVRGAEAAVS